MRTAGVAGTFNYTLSQVPAETPILTIYSDAARTIVAVAATPLVATANPAVFTGAYPSTLPAGTYFLSFSVVMTAGQPAFVDNDDTLELRAVSGDAGTTYVTTADLRALPNLADTAKFTDAELDAAITWFETKFETHVGVAFVPRTATARVSGSGSEILRLGHRPVTSVTAVRIYTTATLSTAYTAAELADVIPEPGGYIRRVALGYWPYGSRNIEVDYVHGLAAPDAVIKDSALWAVREKVLKDHSADHGSRTRGVATEGVFVGNTTGPFFNDEVNAVADHYRDMYRVKFASVAIA